MLAVLALLCLIALATYLSLRAHAAKDDGRFLPITEITTGSGLKIWAVKDNSLPIMVLKFAFIDSGTALDPQDKQGLVRLLSNTMDEGAGDLDSQAFQKELSSHSITLLFNAGRDVFGGELKTLTHHQEKAFELLTLAVNKPRFDDEAVGRMRAANLVRLRSALSQPNWMAARLINDRAFENHPYAKNSGGTISGLTSITPDDLHDFKNTYLTRDRLVIAAAGDIDEEALAQAVDRVFSGLPASAPEKTIPDTAIANEGQSFLFKAPVPQTMIEIMMPGISRKDLDYHALQVLNYIFGGGGFGSRLMDEAREKQGLTYGIYSGIQDYRHASALSVTTSTKNESAALMLSIIKTEMEELRAGGVTQKELDDAKSYITGSMPLSLTSTPDIASVILSLLVNELPIDYLDTFKDKINAVGRDDIRRVAERLLHADKMVTALVGEPQDIETITIEELPNVH